MSRRRLAPVILPVVEPGFPRLAEKNAARIEAVENAVVAAGSHATTADYSLARLVVDPAEPFLHSEIKPVNHVINHINEYQPFGNRGQPEIDPEQGFGGQDREFIAPEQR
jgi:hypothetical protein